MFRHAKSVNVYCYCGVICNRFNVNSGGQDFCGEVKRFLFNPYKYRMDEVNNELATCTCSGIGWKLTPDYKLGELYLKIISI
jgi:hypothetical protein